MELYMKAVRGKRSRIFMCKCLNILIIEKLCDCFVFLLFSCISCLSVYLISGFLYQRLIVGAKGVEQFPNYGFWTEIGNLSAVSLSSFFFFFFNLLYQFMNMESPKGSKVINWQICQIYNWKKILKNSQHI